MAAFVLEDFIEKVSVKFSLAGDGKGTVLAL